MRTETSCKLTKSQSQDDDAELNSQQEEPGDFPQHLTKQQTSWAWAVTRVRNICKTLQARPHKALYNNNVYNSAAIAVCYGNSRFVVLNSIGICLVCEECQPCLFLLDMKAKQSHAEAQISPSGYSIKEDIVTATSVWAQNLSPKAAIYYLVSINKTFTTILHC